MAHQIAGRKLGRKSGPRRALYRNLVSDLVRYERVTTTEAKAKEVRRVAERVITLGKKGTLHHRRQALAAIPQRDVVQKVFDELAPRFAERPGGYTRIIKLGPRRGDAAPMALLELVE